MSNPRPFLTTRADLAESLSISIRQTYRLAPATASHMVVIAPVRDILNAAARNGQPQIEGFCLPRLLSTRRAAERMGVSPRRLLGWAKRGAPHFDISDSHPLWDFEELYAWAQSASGIHKNAV